MKSRIVFQAFLVFAVSSFCFSPRLKAQVAYMHGVGGTYLLGLADEFVIGMPGVSYNARLHYNFSDESGLALSAFPTVGFYGSLNSRTGGAGGVGVDLPLNFQFHWGMGTSKGSSKNIGFYAGTGIDFAAIGAGGSSGSFGGRFIGPDFELGVNFLFRGSPIGIRTKFLYDVSNDNLGVFGLGIVYHLGVK